MSNTFHDYELLSLVHEPREERLQLTFRAQSGVIETLMLRGCTQFRACDVISQNVIDRIIFTSGAGESEDIMRKSLGWMTSLSDSPSYLSSQAEAKVLDGIRSGELILVECIPSYGAEIVALCRSYEVTRG